MKKTRLKKIILLTVDIGLLYVALLITLLIRYGNLKEWQLHTIPFFWVHIVWILMFYSAGMYDWERFPPSRRYYVAKLVFTTMIIAGLFAAGLFYFVVYFSITPKINLLIDTAIVSIFLWIWRVWFLRFSSKGSKIKVLFFGSTEEIKNFAHFLEHTPSLGYRTETVIDNVRFDHLSLKNFIREKNISLVVVEPSILQNKELVRMFYQVLPLGVTIINFPEFYESITGKIPISVINETWFLENLVEINKKSFEIAKRLFDTVCAILLSIPVILLFPFIALFIKLGSEGPIFYFQDRVGKNGKVFKFIKFRSMIQNADQFDGIKGSGNDERHTAIGRILRKTYLDELPQIINVLRGEMSFVGPRPERPKYVEILRQQIPFYEIRLLVRPGITGWAQINMENDASVEDAPQKLQHDLYYIKNRSLIMDLAIALRTASIIIRREGR